MYDINRKFIYVMLIMITCNVRSFQIELYSVCAIVILCFHFLMTFSELISMSISPYGVVLFIPSVT